MRMIRYNGVGESGRCDAITAPGHAKLFLLSHSRDDMTTPESTLEAASPEIKQYQRLKISALLVGTLLSLAWLMVVALWLGPRLDPWLTEHLGPNRWLGLLGMAAFL